MTTGHATPFQPAALTPGHQAAALQRFLLGAVLAAILFSIDINVAGGADTDISIDPQLAIKLALWTLGGALGFVQLKQLLPVFAFPGPLLLATTLGLAVFSTSYSLSPDLTLGSCYGVICTALLIALVMRSFTERAFSALLLWTMVALTLACWVAHFASPGLSARLEYLTPGGEVSARVGGLMHPQALGRTAATLMGIAVIMFRGRQLGGPVMFLLTTLSVGTIYASESRTALIGLVAGLLAIFLRKISLTTLVALFALAAIGSFAAATVVLNDPEVAATAVAKLARTGNVEEIYSLTGRVLVWSVTWEQIQLAPVLGYGFGAAREVFAVAMAGPNQWIAPHSHNALLEVLLSLGFVGGVLFVATLVRQLYLYRRQPRDIPDFILVYIIVTGVLTAGPYTGVPTGLYLVFVTSLFWRPLFPATASTGTGHQT